MDELVIPKLVRRILDQFDESYEQTPRMRPVNYQSLEQNPRYLFLDGLGVRLRKQIQQRTREIVRVAVRISQLVRYSVQEKITSLCVEIDREILEYVHVRAVRDCRHAGGETFAPDVRYGLRSDVQDQGVHQRDVVTHPRFV